MINELDCTDAFEMNYDEYKLNEILGTRQTVIETFLCEKNAGGGSDVQMETNGKVHQPAKEMVEKSALLAGSDFRSLSIQIFKYSSHYLEQPKLFYSVLIIVSGCNRTDLGSA